MTPHRRDSTAGLSLLELVVAMSLFALVAVMGVQSLTGTLRTTERLRSIDEDTASLGFALALIRNDLSSIVPMRFYPPDQTPRTAVWDNKTGTSVGLSTTGQPRLGQSRTDRMFVVWSLDTDAATLSRAAWTTLYPAGQGQAPEPKVVLDGVTGMSLRTFWPDIGWVDGATPPLSAIATIASEPAVDEDIIVGSASVYYSVLPHAIELTLQTERWGDLPIIRALK